MATNDKSPLALPVKIVDPTTSSYQVQVTSTGALSVAPVSGGGAVVFSAIDNVVGPRGPGTAASSSALVAGVYNGGAALAPTSGQQVVMQLTSVAALKVASVDSAGAELNYSLPVAVSTGYPTTKSLARAVLSSATFVNATVIVASSSAQTTRVHRLYFTITTASAVQFLNGSTAMTGNMTIGANGSMFLDLSSEPWFITSTNQSFSISATVTTAINGSVEYITS